MENCRKKNAFYTIFSVCLLNYKLSTRKEPCSFDQCIILQVQPKFPILWKFMDSPITLLYRLIDNFFLYIFWLVLGTQSVVLIMTSPCPTIQVQVLGLVRKL